MEWTASERDELPITAALQLDGCDGRCLLEVRSTGLVAMCTRSWGLDCNKQRRSRSIEGK